MMSISIVNPCFQDPLPTRLNSMNSISSTSSLGIFTDSSRVITDSHPTKLKPSEPLPDLRALSKKLENNQVQTKSKLDQLQTVNNEVDVSQKARTFLQVFLQFIQQTFCFLITFLSFSK